MVGHRIVRPNVGWNFAGKGVKRSLLSKKHVRKFVLAVFDPMLTVEAGEFNMKSLFLSSVIISNWLIQNAVNCQKSLFLADFACYPTFECSAVPLSFVLLIQIWPSTYNLKGEETFQVCWTDHSKSEYSIFEFRFAGPKKRTYGIPRIFPFN